MLILETYVYLRDAAAKSFYHESMTENLWELMADLTVQQAAMIDATHGGDSDITPIIPKEGTPRCSHCRNTSLHKLLEIQSTKKVCVFLDLVQSKARKAAGEALAEFKESPDKSLREICRAVLAKHKG
jgi:hypothetical protein